MIRLSLRPAVLSFCALFTVSPAVLPQGSPPAAPASLALRFEEQAVVISGLRPNGQAVGFSVAREISDGSATIVRREEILDDTDGDGTVRFELDREVPWKSIWVAVDLATGGYVLGTPEGFPLRERTLPEAGLVRFAEGPEALDVAGELAEVLVVRPGLGAWGLTAGDGGTLDDGEPGDRRVSFALPVARGLDRIPGNPAAPERYRPRDLVVVVDPNRMEVAVTRVAEPPVQR
ncbi:MAG TPA: hypothetical protein VL025_02790 [Thermoanaerobaculia bacterium]|nr:hypothetical protein [Thermoanaerobaculia bacterium]